MKPCLILLVGVVILIFTGGLSSCQRQNNICLPTEGTPKPRPVLSDLIALPPPKPQAEPIQVVIGGKNMTVDKLVDYPLCNDTWSEIVYVGCDAQVAEADLDADNNPLFFKGCNLKIAPNTIVYVAAHNDAAYYRGCSCHTGEDPVP